jgi:hypothetical protein
MESHRTIGLVALAVLVAVTLALAQGPQIHRNGFEAREPVWVKGTADAAFRELAHDITDATAHTGQFSEHLQISAEQGGYIHYYYATGRAPIAEELTVSLWLKANRPGIQLMARLVLPKERNPNNLDEPLTTLIRGDLYQPVSRWQRLELRRPPKLAKQQQQLMRAQLQRDVDFTDAYIDRIVLNVYAGGPGMTELWIDDLEIGPVIETPPAQPINRETGVQLQPPGTVPRTPTRAAVVELDHGQLRVDGRRFFFRGIRHSDTPLKALRDAGFNTVWFAYATSPALMEEAVRLGFWVVPVLPATANDPRLTSVDRLRQEIGQFPERDAVLFWDVGGGLTDEQAGLVADAARAVRTADPRPVAGDAWDGLRPYSRNLDLLGAHRWPLMTGLELPQYREWLNQRRLLARDGVFLWTWVQTHLPDWYTTLVYEKPGSAGFNEPIGPQPEQIRLLTYTALASGCRGLGFWSDRFLADSHQGRDRLLTLALLNQELRMLEPLLVTAEEPTWINTSEPDVKAAVLRTERGLLLLPIWLGKGSQFVPGQSASVNLKIVVPQVPMGTQAWEVLPGEVRSLSTERILGGTRITVPEFGLTTAIVFTGDNGPEGLVVRFQDQARQCAKLAAQWAKELADEEIAKVARVEEQLEKAGHPLPQGPRLMEDARKRVLRCVEQWNKGDYREAYLEAQRVVRPLRIVMRAQWEAAVKDLDTPVASPYAVSFYTLPQHWRYMDQVRQGRAGTNVLPNGDFEGNSDPAADGWLPQQATLESDNAELIIRRVTDQPKEGKQCLMLQIKSKNAQLPPRAVLERTFLALNSPMVRLQPGTLVRISGWVRIPQPITASVDGALLYDSAGGEPLAVRLRETKQWQQFTLYRRVPTSGTMSVTLALTGLGTVYFDDVRIEPLLWNNTAALSYPR